MGNNPVNGVDPSGGWAGPPDRDGAVVGQMAPGTDNDGLTYMWNGKDWGEGFVHQLPEISVGGTQELTIGIKTLNYFQTGLDVAGLVPGFGEVADGINAGIYALRGDYVNASLSLAAMVPIAGMVATGGKIVKKGLSNAELVQKAVTKAENAIGGVGRFAGTSKHSYANNLLKRYQKIYGNRGLEFNQYFNGRAGKGFLDVVDHKAKTIYDYKFGNAVMGNAQFSKYSNSFRGYSIRVVRP